MATAGKRIVEKLKPVPAALGVLASVATVIGLVLLLWDRNKVSEATPLAAGSGDIKVSEVGNVAGQGNSTVTNVGGTLTINNASNRSNEPSYPEPTVEEIKAAVVDWLRMYGAKDLTGDALVADGKSGGVLLDSLSIEKFKCAPAAPRAGYVCYYKPSVNLYVYSKKPTALSRFFAEKVNAALLSMASEDGTTGVNLTHRFVKSEAGWMVISRKE